MGAHKTFPQRVEQAVALLRSCGVWTQELCDALGVKGARVGVLMSAAVSEGRAHAFRAGFRMVYFPTLDDMRAFESAHKEAGEARRREQWRAESRQRYLRNRAPEIAARSERRRVAREALAAEREAANARRLAMQVAEAEMRKQRQRLDREARAVEKQREKAEAKKTMQRLKAETKAAGLLAKLKGTASPAPAKPRGPAHIDGPAIIPEGLEVQRFKTPPGRFAAENPPSVISSRECRPWAEAAAA